MLCVNGTLRILREELKENNNNSLFMYRELKEYFTRDQLSNAVWESLAVVLRFNYCVWLQDGF